MNDSDALAVRYAALPSARGRPAIAQGRYGDRGNLELVFPDPHDGMWVCWFNADEPSTATPQAGAVPGEWSGGLHFASGRTYDDVALIQATRGPDFLELVATTDSTIEHWTWTPVRGFVRRGLISTAAPASMPSIGETPDGLVAAAVGTSSIMRWSARATDAWTLDWRLDEEYELPCRTSAAAVRVDSTGRVHGVAAIDGTAITVSRDGRWSSPSEAGSSVTQVLQLDLLDDAADPLLVAATDVGVLAGRIGSLAVADPGYGSALCMARSRIDMERAEIVVRAGQRLVHLRAPMPAHKEVLEAPVVRTIESKVRWPANAPIHRRSGA